MAGQDVRLTLGPGDSRNLQIKGEFIYCKSAPNPVTVIVDGRSMEMIQGDKYRSNARFSEFLVVNDSKASATVVFVVGYGDYTTQVVKGEIMVEPGLRRADGELGPDTRYELEINLMPVDMYTEDRNAGDVLLVSDPIIDERSPYGFQALNLRVFRGEGDTIGVTWGAAASSLKGGAVLYDRKLRHYKSLNFKKNLKDGTSSYSVGEVAYYPGLGYLMIANGGIYVVTGFEDKERERLYSLSGITTMDYVPENGTLVVMNGNKGDFWEIRWNFETGQFEQVRFLNLPRPSQIHSVRYDVVTQEIITAGSFGFIAYDCRTLAETRQSNNNLGDTHSTAFGMVPFGRNWYSSSRSHANPGRMQKFASIDYVTTPRIESVSPGCELFNALYETGEPITPTAEISIEDTYTGAVMRGEVIRAILEWHFKTSIPDGYLDHVYSIDLGFDGYGGRFKPVYSGNRSFSRAEIEDDFSMMLPGKARITIDNELELGPVINVEG